MTATREASFRSCLLIAPADIATRRFIQALHGAGIAVLQQDPGDDVAAMVDRFDFVAWGAANCGTVEVSAIRALREHGRPVIALFGQARPECVSAAFDAGADACLQVDADERVVVAQIEALLRIRTLAAPVRTSDDSITRIGDLSVDRKRCEVRRGAMPIALTPTEFRAIDYMARRAGRLLQPHEILNAISDGYTYEPAEASEVFKVYARRIRKKLEPAPNAPTYLVNVRGFGYRLEDGELRVAERLSKATG